MDFAMQELHFKTKEDFNVEYKGQFLSSTKRYSMNTHPFKSSCCVLTSSRPKILETCGLALVQGATAQIGDR